MTEMTVAEFASKHCTENGEHTQEAISSHINAIVLATLSENRTLWSVGIDDEGRVSLIWVSLTEQIWEALIARGLRLQILFTYYGGVG